MALSDTLFWGAGSVSVMKLILNLNVRFVLKSVNSFSVAMSQSPVMSL